MMVVLFACDLVTCCLARDFDELEPSHLDQTLDVSVDSRNSQGCVMPPRRFESLVGQ